METGAQRRLAQADQVFSQEKITVWRCGCPAQVHACPCAGTGKRRQKRRQRRCPAGPSARIGPRESAQAEHPAGHTICPGRGRPQGCGRKWHQPCPAPWPAARGLPHGCGTSADAGGWASAHGRRGCPPAAAARADPAGQAFFRRMPVRRRRRVGRLFRPRAATTSGHDGKAGQCRRRPPR